jgi:hypothetical protein
VPDGTKPCKNNVFEVLYTDYICVLIPKSMASMGNFPKATHPNDFFCIIQMVYYKSALTMFVCWVWFCRLLFVFLSLYIWPLYLRFLIRPLVSSSFSFIYIRILHVCFDSSLYNIVSLWPTCHLLDFSCCLSFVCRLYTSPWNMSFLKYFVTVNYNSHGIRKCSWADLIIKF